MNTSLLQSRFANISRTGLPVKYECDGRSLTGSSAAVYQKLEFSEWGIENGYEQSIMGKCSDFPDAGHPETDAIITINGQQKRVINCEVDAARVGVRIDLGPLYPT